MPSLGARGHDRIYADGEAATHTLGEEARLRGAAIAGLEDRQPPLAVGKAESPSRGLSGASTGLEGGGASREADLANDDLAELFQDSEVSHGSSDQVIKEEMQDWIENLEKELTKDPARQRIAPQEAATLPILLDGAIRGTALSPGTAEEAGLRALPQADPLQMLRVDDPVQALQDAQALPLDSSSFDRLAAEVQVVDFSTRTPRSVHSSIGSEDERLMQDIVRDVGDAI